MKIASYIINASSERSYMSVESSNTLIRRVPAETAPAENPESDAEAVRLEISEKAAQAMKDAEENMRKGAEKLTAAYKPTRPSAFAYADDIHDVKIRLLEAMLYALTGKRFRFGMEDLSAHFNVNAVNLGFAARGGGAQPAETVEQIQTEHFFYESESVSYKAQGQIRTADGQTVSVDVDLNMSRQFASYEQTSMELRVKNLCDPLIIAYGGSAASLSDETFSFDLDVDGRRDDIHFAGEGSGFLALDKNGDGRINDGGELFGPATGSGFSELRDYDPDQNGWIDENDEVYAKLRVWSKDKDGSDRLFTLKELDVGAIYLGETATQYAINDSANRTKGMMRSTSVYLKDSGGAGTVSHVDLSL